LFGGGVPTSFAPSAAMRTLVASTFGDDVSDLDMARPC